MPDFATAAYLTAYWLRFQGDRLALFIAGAWSTLPVIVISQLIALVITGAYGARPKFDWLVQVVGGVVVGAAAASGVMGATLGFTGVSKRFRRRRVALSRGVRLASDLGPAGASAGRASAPTATRSWSIALPRWLR